jgi:FG-GAP repeat/Astacin (Peptidase family M12A)
MIEIAARFRALALVFFIGVPLHAGQVMDEVWFPAGVIRWGSTQTTPDILDGIRDTMKYYATRTPLQLTEIPYINQGGMPPEELLGTLEVRYSEGVFNDGYSGQTKHYRKPNLGNKMVKLSFERVKTREHAASVLAHEMGHVLGFTHEFQRIDRDDHGVSVDFDLGRDPYNGGRPDKKNVRLTSPYDFASAWATGYGGAKPPHNGPTGSELSKHDINSAYRVYARALGTLTDGIQYGESAATGDFDGDGTADLAIAAQYSAPGADQGSIYFYKGVVQAEEEEGTGTTYVAWFREDIAFLPGQRHTIVLTAGDTHTMTSTTATSPQGDDIDELIVGLPGAARVEIWVVNAAQRFGDDMGTFGGHGIGGKILIHARDVGIDRGAESSEFGASLAAGRFFNGNGDDLAIGAPKGGTVMAVGSTAPNAAAPRVVSGGAGVYLLHDADPKKAVRLTSPDGATGDEFGASLAVLVDFDKGSDTLAVGAPGTDTTAGRVAVYRRASVDRAGAAVAPELLDWFSGSTSSGGFGRSLAAFRTREANQSAHTHWLAVGAPTASLGGQKTGAVTLYSINYAGERQEETRATPPTLQEGMHFGRALAVHLGKCADDLCPKDGVRIAIGSPQATVSETKTGQVFLWNVWSGATVNRTMEHSWNGSNEGARYGQDVIAVRPNQSGGGFLILGKNNDFAYFSGSIRKTARTGLAHVKFNDGNAKWKDWTRTLAPNTAGDLPPSNLLR